MSCRKVVNLVPKGLYDTYLLMPGGVEDFKQHALVVDYCLESVDFLQTGIIFAYVPARNETHDKSCKLSLSF